MGAKFTCDYCGAEITTAFYDSFEGWQSTGTIEWWEEGKPHKEGYHVNSFCPGEMCMRRFFEENNIVFQESEMNYGYGHLVQKNQV